LVYVTVKIYEQIFGHITFSLSILITFTSTNRKRS